MLYLWSVPTLLAKHPSPSRNTSSTPLLDTLGPEVASPLHAGTIHSKAFSDEQQFSAAPASHSFSKGQHHVPPRSACGFPGGQTENCCPSSASSKGDKGADQRRPSARTVSRLYEREKEQQRTRCYKRAICDRTKAPTRVLRKRAKQVLSQLNWLPHRTPRATGQLPDCSAESPIARKGILPV